MNHHPDVKTIKRSSVLASVIILLVTGCIIAVQVREWEWGWLAATLYYGSFMFVSILLIAGKDNLRKMLRPSVNWKWNFLPVIFIIPMFINVFIPNAGLLKTIDYLFVLNIFICLLNPWLEEFYWRGMIHEAFKEKPVLSVLVSAIGFGLSHPLILGISSPGVRGWPGFVGVLAVGLVFWCCYYKTKSLRGCIITHFLIDVAGMSAYILADKAVLWLPR